MSYTSNSRYRYLQRFLPLPSYSLLYKLKSEPIDTCKGLQSLYDTILLLGEMYLQQEVQNDGRELNGYDSNIQAYKAFYSLKQSTPYIIKAIPSTKINHQVVQDSRVYN